MNIERMNHQVEVFARGNHLVNGKVYIALQHEVEEGDMEGTRVLGVFTNRVAARRHTMRVYMSGDFIWENFSVIEMKVKPGEYSANFIRVVFDEDLDEVSQTPVLAIPWPSVEVLMVGCRVKGVYADVHSGMSGYNRARAKMSTAGRDWWKYQLEGSAALLTFRVRGIHVS